MNYEEVDRLVTDYKNGSTEAAGQLIVAFTPYIKKWIDVIKGRWINVMDPEIASMVGMFGSASVTELASHISRATSCDSDEDIQHDIIVMFLTLANRHTGSSGFAAYLVSSMKYRVFDFIVKKLEQVQYTESEDVHNHVPEGVPDTDILSSDMVSELTPRELQMCYMRYMNHVSTNDIARVNKCSVAVVNAVLRSARSKLSTLLPVSDDTGGD